MLGGAPIGHVTAITSNRASSYSHLIVDKYSIAATAIRRCFVLVTRSSGGPNLFVREDFTSTKASVLPLLAIISIS